MSYSKVAKVVQDAPFGIRALNQLDDNNQAVRDIYDAEHFIPSSGQVTINSVGSAAKRHGEHSTPLIPRTVGVVEVAAFTSINGQVSWGLTIPLRGRMVVAVLRFMQGCYIIQTAGGSNLWCEIYPAGTSSAPRRAIIRKNVISNIPGFAVQTLELVSGSWTPRDYSFHFVINAQTT